ncbi:MAG: protein kinase [Mariniblastus sp.]
MSETSQELDLAVRAFESQWESGVVNDFANSIPEQARSNTDLLTDLACIDLKNRVQHDANTRVESYTAAFPQLAKDELVLLELIRTEYFSRTDRQSVDADSYCQRFPQLKQQIEMMFQLEFNGSGDSYTRDASSDWQCTFCDAIVAGREAGETDCRDCGQPVAIGRYELVELAGQGAFGHVYRARDPKLDREIAIKLPRSNRFITPEEIERFLRESRHAAQLDHPGIVRVFDAGRQSGVPYIVSEFVEGEPLSNWLDERELDFREAAVTVKDIVEAVAHAHQRGVIHRDLKPSNIMMVASAELFHPRVMDFGLARRDQSDVTVTLEGQAIGTPAYMSPEQAKGDLAVVGERSDVYSLGVIFYQLLCGEVPFRGNVPTLIQQVINDDPPPPSRFRHRIPRDLETICMKAINREQSRRYPGVKELGDDLSRWLEGKPILARRIGVTGRTWRWCKRRPAVAALLATLAVAIIAGVSGITIQWRAAESARMASEADLSDALESVDRVLGHLGSDTLADIPQAKQLRADVLNDALLFFQRFRQRNPDDPRVAMQVANAHLQVARIQSALGNNDSAMEAYRDGLEGFKKLDGRAPDRTAWQVSMAQAHSAFASFLLRRSQRKEANVQQRMCLALREKIHEENPKSGKHAAKLATARADLGRILTVAHEIEAEYDVAIERLEKLVKEKSSVGYKRDLSRVLNNYSIHLVKVGKNGRAEKCREQAIELLEVVIEEDPGDESKRSLYASCCLQLVKSLREESRTNAAVKYQEKAVATYRQLTEDFPATPRHRERFASVLAEVASLATAERREKDELEARQEAVRQRETLVALFPSKMNYKYRLADALGYLARSLVKADQKLEAEVHMRMRLAIHRELTDEDSVKETLQLVKAIRDLALLLVESESDSKASESKTLEAEADRRMAGINLEQVMTDSLSNTRKLDLLRSLVSLAKKEDDLEKLAMLYRAKIEIYSDGVKLKPNHLGRRSGLAKQWSYLGNTLFSLDRIDESIDAYRAAIQLDEELLADDPDSATYVSQLIGHSSKLGQILIGSRKVEAVKVIRRSLDLSKRLFEERNNEGFRSLRVAVAYMQLGNALVVKGEDFASGLAAYEQAVSISETIDDQFIGKKLQATALSSNAWALVSAPEEKLRNPERAIELINRALAILPENGGYISTLGFALYEIESYEEAIVQLKKSTELDEKQAALNTLLIALAQAKSGNIELARESYENAIALSKVSLIEPELFEIYKLEAEKFFEKAP